MSYFVKALKKAQEQRQGEIRTNTTHLVANKSTSRFMGILITLTIVEGAIIVVICVVTVLAFNINRNEVINLISTIKNQEKEIHDLTVSINKSKVSYEAQINDLNKYLNQNLKETKSKINSLTVAYNDRYVKLKEEMLDNKEQVKALIKESKILRSKLEQLSISNSVTK